MEEERKKWENEHEEALVQMHNEVVKHKLEKERSLAKITEHNDRLQKVIEERESEIRGFKQVRRRKFSQHLNDHHVFHPAP